MLGYLNKIFGFRTNICVLDKISLLAQTRRFVSNPKICLKPEDLSQTRRFVSNPKICPISPLQYLWLNPPHIVSYKSKMQTGAYLKIICTLLALKLVYTGAQSDAIRLFFLSYIYPYSRYFSSPFPPLNLPIFIKSGGWGGGATSSPPLTP